MSAARQQAGQRDWTDYVFPGPRRRFSAEELAQAGQQPWQRFVDHYVLGSLLAVLAVNYSRMPKQQAPFVFVGLLLLSWFALNVARRLWRQPTRLALNAYSIGAGLLVLSLVVLGFKWMGKAWMELPVALLLVWFLLASSAWWFLVIYRVQQIEARLREIEDKRRHEALQSQLLQAQIQPHFLFNSLASLDHWVESRDERATPLLRSLTAFLRATLPLFNRQQLSLGEELAAVRAYLAVMQARLGSRLAVDIDVPETLMAQPLPPALLLTLAENAIEHGVLPKLGPAQLGIRAWQEGELVRIDVRDDGPGLPAGGEPLEPGRGLGLANSRLRLAQALGEQARLTLSNAGEAGGCVASLHLPLRVAGARGEAQT